MPDATKMLANAVRIAALRSGVDGVTPEQARSAGGVMTAEGPGPV